MTAIFTVAMDETFPDDPHERATLKLASEVTADDVFDFLDGLPDGSWSSLAIHSGDDACVVSTTYSPQTDSLFTAMAEFFGGAS